MQNAMDDESFHDVRLVGSDNVEVSAAKWILAIRSQYFKLMFLGSSVEGSSSDVGRFAERDSNIVRLPYLSSVLKVLVKYCSLDELDLDLISGDEGCLSDDDAVRLVQLRDAARYVQFSNDDVFESITDELVDSLIYEQDEECMCAVLSELLVRGEGQGNPLWDSLMHVIQSKPSECLFPTKNPTVCKGIEGCSPRLLRSILDQIVDDPFAVLRCLQTWYQQNGINEGEYEDDDIQALQLIAQTVDLKSIPPSKLSKIKPDRFFTMERLYEAFVHHGNNNDATSTSDGSPSSSFPAPKKRVAFVTGAGVDCVNGIYESVQSVLFGVGDVRYYCKSGTYGEMESRFILTPSNSTAGQSEGMRWTITIIPTRSPGSDFTENGIPLLLYETKSPIVDGEKVPFSSWKCVDGASPAPCVAITECLDTSHAPGRFDPGLTQQPVRPPARRINRRTTTQLPSRPFGWYAS